MDSPSLSFLNESHYSLLDGRSTPEDMAERCSDIGVEACALTDHGTIAGAVQFIKAMKKKDVKPILGCEFYINRDVPETKRAKNTHLVVLAKNYQGWLQLIKSTSFSNDPVRFKGKPRLKLEELAEFVDGNLVAFSGHMGSDLSTCIFTNPGHAFSAKSVEEAQKYLYPNALKRAVNGAKKYEEIFGKGNFFIEIQRLDIDNMPSAVVIADVLREASKVTGIPCVATPDAHYASPEDAVDQRMLLCTAINTTFMSIEDRMQSGKDVPLGAFFRSKQYHIPDKEEILKWNTEEEIDNTKRISDMCEEYSLSSKPRLPVFPSPDGQSSVDYMRQLARDGWRDRIPMINRVIKSLPQHNIQEYADRVKREMSVLQDSGLSDYFLIVKDFVDAARSRGEFLGPGRGSSAGSLVLYLLGVTQIDPIEYDLLFERFYNAGRNTADRVSLPDIDTDFEVTARKANLDYCRRRYGKDKVSQMITFSCMKGSQALKDVLRAHSACGPDEMNRITQFFPEEADISDQLENMEKRSIILWTLENSGEPLREWAYIDDKGKIQGKFAKMFEQAIRVEGVKRSMGKHAAGMVISQEPLSNVCPMVYDKKEDVIIAGMEMDDLELCGHIKFDMLSNSSLDKCHMCSNQLLQGELGYD